jgi:hypothetical protein
MLTITETNLAGLPSNLQDQINQNLSASETVLMCIFYYESSFLTKVESALVLTDFKLMEHRTDFKLMDKITVSWTSSDGSKMVWLEKVSHIEDRPSRGEIVIHSVASSHNQKYP